MHNITHTPITNTEIPITIGVITDDPLARDKLVSIYKNLLLKVARADTSVGTFWLFPTTIRSL